MYAQLTDQSIHVFFRQICG